MTEHTCLTVELGRTDLEEGLKGWFWKDLPLGVMLPVISHGIQLE